MLRALLLSCLLAAAAVAQPAPRYSEVRIALDGPDIPARLAAHGLALDHAHRDGDGLVVVLDEAERAWLAASGLAYDVLVDDLAAHYAARPALSAAERTAIERADPLRGFEFGSMAGFYTFAEMVAELDSMALLYPGLATEKVSLGQSHEGRDIWMVQISDQPGVDEGEPEVLYTAIHHAREPQSMMTVLYFMYYLLENYGTDPEVTALVNDRALYFVPMVNPDGYVYNETTHPQGGGLWRKNRRVNGDGTFGVDPNRNYGYNWGYDDAGSSPVPGSSTYRGPAPFSEPENQAIRDLAERRRFAAAIHYHSRGEEYLYPWEYATATYTPDDGLFHATSAEMAQFNGYAFGTAANVLYPVNGGANDWFYGEQTTKPKALSWVAEVCNRTTDGFWPPMDRIFPIAQENVHANLTLAHLAGTMPVASEAPAPTPERLTLAAAPNPARSTVDLSVSGAAVGPLTVAVYDLLGRQVLRHRAPHRAGRQSHPLSLSALTPGVYVVAVTDAAGHRVTQRIVRY